jgi:NADPH:quinone reductase
MQALAFNETGEPHAVLRLVDLPRPQPRVGEVLVKVMARPIHPADLAFIRGQYRLRPVYPQVAGLEGAGVVVEGADFASGTRVAFRWPGSWAEFATVPVGRIIAVPADISDVAASQISLNPITAWALLDEAQVTRGDTILITAATSTVSNIVAAIARQRGIEVIGLARGDAARAAPRSKAERLLSADDPELTDKIVASTRGKQIVALLDSVGGPILSELFAALSPGARVIAYGVQDSTPTTVTNAILIYSNLTWKGFGIDRWLSMLDGEAKARMIDELWSMVRDELLPLAAASRHALADFPAALAADGAAGRTGKVLLVSREVTPPTGLRGRI